MYYFAYGSNMLTARLRRRVPRARPLGPARLAKHVLRFHKRGGDGSGKCNVVATGDGGDQVYGVLFEINQRYLPRLHHAEGPGYEFVPVRVETDAGAVEAVLYRARPAWQEDALAPYTWYQRFVVAGAREHRLPADYIARLANIYARPDRNRWRALKNRWIARRTA